MFELSAKSDADVEREKSLIDQWVCLTEERNAVLVPAAGSHIPGAPAHWDPPSGMEEHVPVVFLDLDSKTNASMEHAPNTCTCDVTWRVFLADSMTTPLAREGFEAAGINSILPKEHGAKFFVLPVVRCFDDVGDAVRACVVSWDSSIHDSLHLNRVTPTNERVYLIVKVQITCSSSHIQMQRHM